MEAGFSDQEEFAELADLEGVESFLADFVHYVEELVGGSTLDLEVASLGQRELDVTSLVRDSPGDSLHGLIAEFSFGHLHFEHLTNDVLPILARYEVGDHSDLLILELRRLLRLLLRLRLRNVAVLVLVLVLVVVVVVVMRSTACIISSSVVSLFIVGSLVVAVIGIALSRCGVLLSLLRSR